MVGKSEIFADNNKNHVDQKEKQTKTQKDNFFQRDKSSHSIDFFLIFMSGQTSKRSYSNKKEFFLFWIHFTYETFSDDHLQSFHPIFERTQKTNLIESKSFGKGFRTQTI